jgi:hypothetical protein
MGFSKFLQNTLKLLEKTFPWTSTIFKKGFETERCFEAFQSFFNPVSANLSICRMVFVFGQFQSI